MDDHVPRVDEHPVARTLPLEPGDHSEIRLQPLGEPARYRRDLPRRPARADHHVIAHDASSAQVDADNVLGLAFVKRRENRVEKRCAGRGAARSRCALAAGGGHRRM